jgi:outer membrane biosynthesis protein TonB
MSGRRVPRQGPVRAALAACLVAVLGAALVGRERPADREVLATAVAPPHEVVVAPATGPPVQLPHPRARQVRQPASLSAPASVAPASGMADIPGVALAAYQRSAVVIGTADPSCRLDWALLAAIGQVESDHGQVGGSHLGRQGVAHPAIVGPRLDGRHGTSRVADTDAGRLDGDRRFDRAVGPMQFLPSTWAAVAVDGDDDGLRDVQDIDDAALGAAVYLCAAQDDLSTRAGERQALLRYNHSRAYAALVLAIAEHLRASSVFESGNVSVMTVAELSDVRLRGPGRHRQHEGNRPHPASDPQGPAATDPAPDPAPSPAPSPTPTVPTPTEPTPTEPTPTEPTPTEPTEPTPTEPTPTEPTPTEPTPTDPTTEPPVLTDPLPPELADLTSAQVDAFNAGWATCDDDLVAGWSADAAARDALTQCLAGEIGVATDDPDLVAFVDWLARTQDDATD